MKKPVKRSIAPRALPNAQLQQVAGGRGGYCGTAFHCDCGYAFDPNYMCQVMQDYGMGFDYNCPGCGSSMFV